LNASSVMVIPVIPPVIPDVYRFTYRGAHPPRRSL
jgi:hypothetical protein